MKKTTIVMALFDIGRDKWENFTMSYHTYFSWMRNTLSIDSNMVIFTDGTYEQEIEEYRRSIDPEFKKTVIIHQELKDTEGYKLFNDPLEKLMYSEEFKSKVWIQVPEMTKPLYNVVMFSKMYYLKEAKDKNYFDTDLYIWADAGGLRERESIYKNKVWPNQEKLANLDDNKATFFSHHSLINIHNNQDHALSQMRFIQGTAFFMPAHMIDFVTEVFTETVFECIEQGYIGSDEKIFDFIYLKNPEKYHLIKCDWRTYFNLFKDPPVPSLDGKRNIFIDLGTHECQGLNHFVNHELDIDDTWEIHTFEPNPLIDVENCTKNFFNFNLTVHRKAVWIKNGNVTFKQYGDAGKSQGSLLEETNGGKSYGDYYNETEVECIDLHEFIMSLDPNSNIYIKMDVEWAEYEIVKHMLALGWPENIKKIWIEWHNIAVEEFKIESEDLMKKIEDHNTEVINWH